MRLRDFCFLVVTIAMFSGCAGSPLRKDLRQVAVEHPTCEGKEDCELKWARAVQWITKNSSFRIRLMNDILIETYPSVGSLDAFIAYRITRVPLGQEKYRLEIQAACGNLFGCVKNPGSAMVELSQYIRTGQ